MALAVQLVSVSLIYPIAEQINIREKHIIMISEMQIQETYFPHSQKKNKRENV